MWNGKTSQVLYVNPHVRAWSFVVWFRCDSCVAHVLGLCMFAVFHTTWIVCDLSNQFEKNRIKSINSIFIIELLIHFVASGDLNLFFKEGFFTGSCYFKSVTCIPVVSSESCWILFTKERFLLLYILGEEPVYTGYPSPTAILRPMTNQVNLYIIYFKF